MFVSLLRCLRSGGAPPEKQTLAYSYRMQTLVQAHSYRTNKGKIDGGLLMEQSSISIFMEEKYRLISIIILIMMIIMVIIISNSIIIAPRGRGRPRPKFIVQPLFCPCRGKIKALLKRSFFLTKPLILGIGASKVLPNIGCKH